MPNGIVGNGHAQREEKAMSLIRLSDHETLSAHMSLMFPNASRSYDATRRAVRFWGYDTAMEWSFFVTEDSLKRVQPNMRFDEESLLSAFDANRELIYATAAKVYARS